MRVLLGNDSSPGVPEPTITYSDVRDDTGYIVGSDAAAVKDHIFDNPGLVTHLPGNDIIMEVVNSFREQSGSKPTWVVVEPGEHDPEKAADLQRFLAEFWRIPEGYPADLEATHHTFNGPPGVGVENV